MTKTTVQAMVHKRSKREGRMTLNLRKSRYLKYRIAAAERKDKRCRVNKSQTVLGELGEAKEVKPAVR